VVYNPLLCCSVHNITASPCSNFRIGAFCGLCAGAIVNLWFPNWLLAFIWVVAMLGSNIELLLSFVKYLRVKREANSISRQLRLVSPPTSNGGNAAPAAPGSCAPEPAMSGSEREHQRGQLLTRAQLLAKRAHKIEARALLYPTLYVPDVGRALQVCWQSARVCVWVCGWSGEWCRAVNQCKLVVCAASVSHLL